MATAAENILTRVSRKLGLKASVIGKIAPMDDRLLVQPLKDDEEQVTQSGIVLVKTGRVEPPSRGLVLAVGPGRTTDQGVLIPMKLKTGAEILFGKFSGTELEVEGVKVLLVREADVFAVLR